MSIEQEVKWAKATDAFYKWEEETEVDDLGDEERLIWCEGFIYALDTYNKEV